MADGPTSDEQASRVTDGSEPLEEVGPSESEANAGDVQRKPTDIAMGQPPQESEFSMRSEMDEQFPIEPIPMVAHPTDGLPTPAHERGDLAIAQPFTVQSVVCIEDNSAWVEVFDEELADYQERYGVVPRAMFHRLQLRDRFDPADGAERVRCVELTPTRRWGHMARQGDVAGCFVLLRPIRERCIHYKRQVFANDDVPNPDEPGHKIFYRNCAARRSVGGALMSLRDEAVYACDYRIPGDAPTVAKYLDEPDHHRIVSNAHLKHLPLFGLTGEPHDIAPRPPQEPLERDPAHAETTK